jgi:hypothetical protein
MRGFGDSDGISEFYRSPRRQNATSIAGPDPEAFEAWEDGDGE